MPRASRARTPDAARAARPAELDTELGERFERWLDAAVARHSPPLSWRELRVGVQALSSLYVEGRGAGRLGARALTGAGKRAAFATYYTALHWLTLHHLVGEWGAGWAGGPRRIVDLGCGAGAAGAALATALGSAGARTDVLGIDRSGPVLAEARHTYRAFGLRARTQRATLPAGLGRPAGAGTLVVAGWTLNELEAPAGQKVRDWLAEHARAGGAWLVAEPLAGPVTPWWDDACAQLGAVGAASGEFKRACRLPAWIQKMDRAAQLDHRVLGARWLAFPSP